MASVYVLVQTDLGRTGAVVRAARDLAVVDSADGIAGAYDVIVRATDGNGGSDIVTALQALPGVNRTITCVVQAPSVAGAET